MKLWLQIAMHWLRIAIVMVVTGAYWYAFFRFVVPETDRWVLGALTFALVLVNAWYGKWWLTHSVPTKGYWRRWVPDGAASTIKDTDR